MKKSGLKYMIHGIIGLGLILALWPVTGFAADFLLQWNPNSESDQVIGYYLYYREGLSMAGDPAAADQKVDIPLDTEGFDPAHPSYTLTDLKYDTLYYFAISAYNSAGEGPLSEEASLSKSSEGDHQAPVVTAPDNMTLTAPDDDGLPAADPVIVAFLSGVTALDDVDGEIATITNDAPDQFPVGVTTVTFSATDSAGNTGTAQATVTVNAPQDTTPPVIYNGRPIGTLAVGTTQVSLQVTTDEPATCRWSPTADTAYADMVDTFANTGTTGHSTIIDGLADGESYEYYVRCMDADDNADSDDYSISWEVAVEDQDVQAPIVTAPLDITLTAPDNTGVPALDAVIVAFLSGATAMDDVDGEITTITHDAPDPFPIGATTVTFSATDSTGHAGSAQATVTVRSPNDPASADPSDPDTSGSDGDSGSDGSSCFIGSMIGPR